MSVDIFSIIGQILVGILIADFLSGIVHWIQDRLISKNLPILGVFAKSAKEHHVYPHDYLNASFLKRNRGIFAITGIVSTVWLVVLGFSWVWLSATFISIISGYIHDWTHKSPDNIFIHTVRATGLIQSPVVHARHHRFPYTTNYCTITNWLNPVLDKIEFWKNLEALTNHRQDNNNSNN